MWAPLYLDVTNWVQLAPTWAQQYLIGPNWSQLRLNWAQRQLCSTGLNWARLGSTGLDWARLGSTGLYWALLGSTWLYWSHFGPTGLNWGSIVLRYGLNSQRTLREDEDEDDKRKREKKRKREREREFRVYRGRFIYILLEVTFFSPSILCLTTLIIINIQIRVVVQSTATQPVCLAAMESWNHLIPSRTQKWNDSSPMVVWGFPMRE